MIRDPSDGSVRTVVDEKAQSMSTRTAKLNADSGLLSSTTSGIRQPTRTDAQDRLERSRQWLKDYHERNAAHARGNGSEQKHQADGRTGDDQGEAEPGLSGSNGTDHGASRKG